MTVRPTRSYDIAALQKVVERTGLFPGDLLPEMVGGFLSNGASGDVWLTAESEGKAIGFCYAAPEDLADGAWNMRAIAVLPSEQRGGQGGALVAHLEDLLKRRGQRILIADTSGTDSFAPTREFYRRNGYAEEARIRDFWAAGDDKIVFWKSLA